MGVAPVQIDEPRLACQHDRREQIVRAPAHRHDVGLDHLRAVALLCGDDGLERPEGPGALGVERRRSRRQGTPGAELACEEEGACLSVERRIRLVDLAKPVDELADGVVVGVGVLAHVERRELDAEGRQRARSPLEPAAGDQLAAVQDERLADELELGHQLRPARVVPPRLVRAVFGEAPPRVHKLQPHAGELEPIRLLGVHAPVARLELGEHVEVGGERFLELRRDAGDPQRARQLRAQLVDHREGAPDAVLVLQVEHAARALGAHVRVAVAVAADPAAEGEGPRAHGQLIAEPGELPGEPVEHVWDGVAMELVEVVDGVASLVDHVGACDSQLVGLPQEVDELLEPAAVALRLVQGGRHLPQLREHRASGCLGGMRGEHGPHRQPAQLVVELVARDVGGGDALDGLPKPRAAAAARAGQLAPAMDLLGDVRQVEVRREGADELRGRVRVDPSEQPRSLVAVLPHEQPHSLDQLEQLGALLPDQRLAQEGAQLADVPAQLGLGVRGGLEVDRHLAPHATRSTVRASMKRAVLLALLVCAAAPTAAVAQDVIAVELEGPRVVATGTAFELAGSGPPGARVQIEIGVKGRWRPLAGARANGQGRFERRVRPARPRGRYLLRAVGPSGQRSNRVTVRSRHVTLASVGDINLGDAPGTLIASLGVRYPWTSVAPVLRRADVAFGNLECAVSTRGAPVPKQYTFRGAAGAPCARWRATRASTC